VIDIGHIEIVSISDCLGILTAFFDEGVHLTDADSTPPNVGFGHQIVFDPSRFTL